MDKVLIIDDSAFDRKMIRKAIMANKPAVEITELSDGQSVVEIMARENPKVTILDIRMPGLDGFDILSQIRAIPGLEHHSVLMVSGSNEDQDREMAQSGGADGYYVKPPTVAAYFSLGRNIYDQYLCCTSRANEHRAGNLID